MREMHHEFSAGKGDPARLRTDLGTLQDKTVTESNSLLALTFLLTFSTRCDSEKDPSSWSADKSTCHTSSACFLYILQYSHICKQKWKVQMVVEGKEKYWDELAESSIHGPPMSCLSGHIGSLSLGKTNCTLCISVCPFQHLQHLLGSS